MPIIYKITPLTLWREAEATGTFAGAPIDHEDGYIHFSTAAQVRDTAARYFVGKDDLVLVAIDGDRLGDALRWEPSRDGDLFPHLYRTFDVDEVLWVKPLPLGADGAHLFPEPLS